MEANDLNNVPLANNAKRLMSQFDNLSRDLSVNFYGKNTLKIKKFPSSSFVFTKIQLEEIDRRFELLQKLTSECLNVQQTLQNIQNQLSPISDTYGDREILQEKLKRVLVGVRK